MKQNPRGIKGFSSAPINKRVYILDVLKKTQSNQIIKKLTRNFWFRTIL